MLPRRYVFSPRFQRESQREVNPDWTINTTTAQKYTFDIELNHPNLKKTSISLVIDHKTTGDQVANYIEKYVEQMLPSYEYTVYTLTGTPKSTTVPYVKDTIRPGVGYSEPVFKFHPRVEVAGNLRKVLPLHSIKSQMTCSTCGLTGALVRCRGRCGHKEASFCSDTCESKHWNIQAHHLVCQSK